MSTKHLGPWIALAGAFVGAGLYLGLRERGRATRDSGTTLAEPMAPERGPEPDVAAVERELRAAIEPQRLAWRRACWDPIVATAPTPARSVHELSIAIDASGKEVLRALNDLREQTRLDVAMCLRDQPHEPIVIGAPGQAISTTVPIVFP